jgi:hypothetical protein
MNVNDIVLIKQLDINKNQKNIIFPGLVIYVGKTIVDILVEELPQRYIAFDHGKNISQSARFKLIEL